MEREAQGYIAEQQILYFLWRGKPRKKMPPFFKLELGNKLRDLFVEKETNGLTEQELDEVCVSATVQPSVPPSFQCTYSESNTHTPNTCWDINPWAAPKWYLRERVKTISPVQRQPSRETREMWTKKGLKPPFPMIMDVYDHSYDYLCAVLVKRQELKVVHEGYVDVLDLPEQRPPPPTQQWPKRPKILTVTRLSDIL